MTPEAMAALPLIYEAAASPGRWRRALDAVAKAGGAKAAALLIRSEDHAARDRQMLSTAYLDFSRTAAGLYYAVVLSRLQAPDWDHLSHQPEHTFIPDTDTGSPPEDLDRRGDYRMISKRLGTRRRVGVRLNGDRLWFDGMSLAYGAEHDAVPMGQAAHIVPLLPHLTRAVELSRLFLELRDRYHAVLAALDRVQVGLAIALPSGELLVKNSETARILDLADGLALDPNARLKLEDAETSAELRAAIGSATAVGSSAEYLISARRPSGTQDFLISVSPLADGEAEIGEGGLLALVTILDPARMPELKVDRFAQVYGLTSAEAEVLQLVLRGHGTNEIAERRGTAPVTAKNQLSAILNKTEARSRAGLLRLVVRVLPPVA